MMSFLNFDLARALTEQRQAQALEAYRRRRWKQTRKAQTRMPATEAEVIELVFPASCEADRIGA